MAAMMANCLAGSWNFGRNIDLGVHVRFFM